uniref:Uncharacterized protein n=1 Tax=Anguilla anguilla TaxID=7936 RepID=A0A0E9UXP6_ANGAN
MVALCNWCAYALMGEWKELIAKCFV